MLNRIWPWSRLSELAKDNEDMRLAMQHTHALLDAAKYRESLLRAQLTLASNNDARDEHGRYKKQEE